MLVATVFALLALVPGFFGAKYLYDMMIFESYIEDRGEDARKRSVAKWTLAFFLYAWLFGAIVVRNPFGWSTIVFILGFIVSCFLCERAMKDGSYKDRGEIIWYINLACGAMAFSVLYFLFCALISMFRGVPGDSSYLSVFFVKIFCSVLVEFFYCSYAVYSGKALNTKNIIKWFIGCWVALDILYVLVCIFNISESEMNYAFYSIILCVFVFACIGTVFGGGGIAALGIFVLLALFVNLFS